MRKTYKTILSVLLFTAIPSVLSYVSNSNLLFEKLINQNILSKDINIQYVQDICSWLSILLSVILLSLNLARTQIEFDNVLEQRNLLIKMNKDNLRTALCEKFSGDFNHFDIRLFIPKHPKLYALYDFLGLSDYKTFFVVKNIPQIADPGVTSNLEFQVSPQTEKQGLVGECYNDGRIVYDDNLAKTNSKLYNLKNNQITQTVNLEWSICCPIFSSYNKVVAIIALDGKNKLSLNNEKIDELRKQILVFSKMLYEAVPQLFRR